MKPLTLLLSIALIHQHPLPFTPPLPSTFFTSPPTLFTLHPYLLPYQVCLDESCFSYLAFGLITYVFAFFWRMQESAPWQTVSEADTRSFPKRHSEDYQLLGKDAGLCPMAVSAETDIRRFLRRGYEDHQVLGMLIFVFYLVCFIYMWCVRYVLPLHPLYLSKFFPWLLYMLYLHVVCDPSPPPISPSSPSPSSPLSLFSHIQGWILFALLLSILTNYVCLCFFRRMQGSAPWQRQQKQM